MRRRPNVEMARSRLPRWHEAEQEWKHDDAGTEGGVDVARYRPWLLSILGTLAAMALGYLAISNSGAEEEAAASVDSSLPTVPDDSPGATLAELSRSTVQLIGVNDAGEAVCTGSGIIVDPVGVILTNAHVVTRNEACPFTTLGVALTRESDQPPEMVHTAQIIETDDRLDLAVVRIAGWSNPSRSEALPADFPAATLGDSDTVELGDRLRILGYPAIGGDTITATDGVVSGFTSDPDIGDRALMKTDATISAGNSGGMAVNADGEVVGIPFRARASDSGPAVDCRPVNDTNGDGTVDGSDSCVTVGGFVNGIRPINLAVPLLDGVLSNLSSPAMASVVDGVSISNARFSSDQENNAPVDDLLSARPGMTKLCLFTDWSGIPDGTRWDGLWYHDGVPVPGVELSDVWKFGESGNNFWICATDSVDGIEPGVYEVALFLNGEFTFAEAISVADLPPPVHEVRWVNRSGRDLCGLAVNPLTDSHQVGVDELPTGQRIPDGGEVTMALAEGTIVAEAYDCDGRPLADALDGLEVTGPVIFEIGA